MNDDEYTFGDRILSGAIGLLMTISFGALLMTGLMLFFGPAGDRKAPIAFVFVVSLLATVVLGSLHAKFGIDD